jgi:hypothetical protein
MNTNWSSPKTNIIAGINDLRKCLADGYKARLIRLENEKCAYPIKKKKKDQDFRNYKFAIELQEVLIALKRIQIYLNLINTLR